MNCILSSDLPVFVDTGLLISWCYFKQVCAKVSSSSCISVLALPVNVSLYLLAHTQHSSWVSTEPRISVTLLMIFFSFLPLELLYVDTLFPSSQLCFRWKRVNISAVKMSPGRRFIFSSTMRECYYCQPARQVRRSSGRAVWLIWHLNGTFVSFFYFFVSKAKYWKRTT